MTREEYDEYRAAVSRFFSEGLRNLSAIDREPFFGKSPCQCCGTTLAGDRQECNGFNERTREVEAFDSVCQDCVYFAEYGRLDDMTMSEIESTAPAVA